MSFIRCASVFTFAALSTCAFASSAPSECHHNNPVNGFYVGAGIGTTSFVDQLKTPNERHQLGNMGFAGQLLLGYEFTFANHFGFGLEAFGTGTTAQASVNHYTNSSVLRSNYNYNYGVRVLPGYQFGGDTIAFLTVGYVRGNFKLTDNGVYGTVSNNYNTNGYQLGLGMARSLSEHFGIRVDFIYNGYSSDSFNGVSTTGTAVRYKNQNNSRDGFISLIYKFAS